MKSKVIIIGLLVILHCGFTSCNGEEFWRDAKPETSNLSVKNDPVVLSLNEKGESGDLYQVTKEDVSNFSRSLRPNKDYEMTFYVNRNDTLLYLLDYGDEWIIVAGDKRINPFVAESDKDRLSFDTANEELKVWIDSYADEVRVIRKDTREVENEHTKFWNMISQNKPKIKVKTRNPEYKWAVVTYTYIDSETPSDVVSHLTSTEWGQKYPWNADFPADINNSNWRCRAGCGPVAFAQMVYYMHYHLGKPTALYHDISVASSVSGPTANIGFSRSGLNSNSTRWNSMALNYTQESTSYVGDLLLDIGNRFGSVYSGEKTSGNISASAANYYNLTFSVSNYNYQLVKTDLQNSKPVYVTASYKDPSTNEYEGHAWLIDGWGFKTRHYTIQKTFEYTENWMYASEYYDTFDELRARYHINSEYDVVEEDGGTNTSEYLRMNWGQSGVSNGGYYDTYPSSTWTFHGDFENYNYYYEKKIRYDFR